MSTPLNSLHLQLATGDELEIMKKSALDMLSALKEPTLDIFLNLRAASDKFNQANNCSC